MCLLTRCTHLKHLCKLRNCNESVGVVRGSAFSTSIVRRRPRDSLKEHKIVPLQLGRRAQTDWAPLNHNICLPNKRMLQKHLNNVISVQTRSLFSTCTIFSIITYWHFRQSRTEQTCIRLLLRGGWKSFLEFDVYDAQLASIETQEK